MRKHKRRLVKRLHEAARWNDFIALSPAYANAHDLIVALNS